jgi:hypothetical protein
MMNSLKASIPFVAEILRLNRYALHERQRALAGKGLLEFKPGYGPGSGTPFTPETVAVLLISMLATDSIKDSAEITSAFCNAPLSARSWGKKSALGGALTFKAAIVNALTLDKYAEEIVMIRVHRMQSTAHIDLARRGGRLSFSFSKETPHVAYGFEGMTGFYQITGDGPLAKIRALLRDNEKVSNENAAPAKAPAKKRSALRKEKA